MEADQKSEETLQYWTVSLKIPQVPSATPVEQGSKIGYAKAQRQPLEKLGAVLGATVGAPTAEVELADVNGLGYCAISIVHSPISYVLQKKEGRRTLTKQEIKAVQEAAGLLPFLIWIAAYDHTDDTNLVVDVIPGNTEDNLRVVAIDFGDALAFEEGPDHTHIPQDSALLTNPDRAKIETVLSNIENLSDDTIDDICRRYLTNNAMQTARTLNHRKKKIRRALQEAGIL